MEGFCSSLITYGPFEFHAILTCIVKESMYIIHTEQHAEYSLRSARSKGHRERVQYQVPESLIIILSISIRLESHRRRESIMLSVKDSC